MFENDVCDLSARVENLIVKNSKIAFIFESPHKEEVKTGTPLAGLSGKEVSKYLLAECAEIPFGIAVQENIVKNTSVLNISQFPLQGSAYTHNLLKPPENIKKLQKLKARLEGNATMETSFEDPELCKIRDEIFSKFILQINCLPANCLLVPCGRFAQKFTKKALVQIKTDFQYQPRLYVPHPSSKWTNVSAETIKTFLSYIEIKC